MVRLRTSPESSGTGPPGTEDRSGRQRPPGNDDGAAKELYHDNEVAVAEEPRQGVAGRLSQRLAGIGQRLPAPLRTSLARFARWRLALLAGVVLLVLLWFGVAATSTSIYSATVLVTETRHGIAAPEALFDFGDLPPSAAIDHNLTLKNDGRMDTYIMIMVFGDIRDFLDIEDAFFNLKSGQERKILVKLSVPTTAEPGKRFSGRVVVTRLPWGLPW